MKRINTMARPMAPLTEWTLNRFPMLMNTSGQ